MENSNKRTPPPKFVDCKNCPIWEGCVSFTDKGEETGNCTYKTENAWDNAVVAYNAYNNRSDEMYEHYYPTAKSEDDMIIESECARRGISPP